MKVTEKCYLKVRYMAERNLDIQPLVNKTFHFSYAKEKKA